MQKFKKKLFFLPKSYFFSLKMNYTWTELSFEVYNSLVAQNFTFSSFFAWKIQSLIYHGPSFISTLLRGLYLVSRVWSIKNCTNIFHYCVNKKPKKQNLIKSVNYWHLSHSKMVHNLFVSSFSWIVWQILSKKKFFKIPHFGHYAIIQMKIENGWKKKIWLLFQNYIIPQVPHYGSFRQNLSKNT